jgi:ParB family chromosome partitioning protein
MIFHRFVDNKPQAEETNVINKVVELEVAKIAPNPSQPRVIFDDYELSQLAISIQQNGILQPLTIRRRDDTLSEKYELIAGERRLRAAKLAGLTKVPCIVMDASARKSAVLAVMENIQRSDLNYIEEAYAIKRLIELLGITQEEAAVKLGLAQSTVANKLRLLRLSDEEKTMVLQYRLNERQSRALLRLPPELRTTAIEKIAAQQMNTTAADKLIDELLAPPKPARKPKTFYIKQASLYINTFNHTIDSMKKAGIECIAKKKKTDDFVEYTVRIPLK